MTLSVREPATAARAVVLVLHGGKEHSTRPTRAWHPAVLRMVPFAQALRRAGPGLVVARLRYRVQGWNGATRSPVADALAALRELTARYPGLPVALVGHSLGGRVALAVAGEPGVRAVVALAPWIDAGDPPVPGPAVLVAHGTRDRVTSPRASARYAEQVGACYVSVRGASHTLLYRARLWHRLAAGYVVATVLGESGSGAGDVTKLVHRALAGEASLVV